MMRSFRRLQSFPGFAARGAFWMFLAVVATPSGMARAQADSTVGEPAWLPLPVEDIEAPELLDDPLAPELGFLVRVDVRDGNLRQARSAVEATARGVVAGMALLTGPRGETQAATGSLRGARLELDAGRLAARGLAPLLAEDLALAASSGRVPAPRALAPAFVAPPSAAGRTLDGVALAWRPAPGPRGGPALWALGGRRCADGTSLGALGFGARRAGAAWSATWARTGQSSSADLSAEWRSARAHNVLAFDAVSGRGGVATIVAVRRAAGPLRVQARWRWRSRDLRGVASEIAGEAGSRRAHLRLRMEGYPSGATGSTSRVELEGRLVPPGQGPFSFRLGRVRTEGFSNAAGFHEGSERYAVGELMVARARGRTLTLLASRRDRETIEGTRRGSSLGGRLGLAWPDRAQIEVQLEGFRADAGGGTAWSSALYAGGATALRTYARPGIGASARGALRLGRWTLGGLVEERDDASGERATAASVWVGRSLEAGVR
jgi:hypothetical protein